MGMVGGMLPANSADMGIRKHLGDESFWPVYAEAERLNVPLAVHGAPSLGLGLNMLPNVGQLMLEHPVARLRVSAGAFAAGGLFGGAWGVRWAIAAPRRGAPGPLTQR